MWIVVLGLEFAELNICELKFRFKNSEKYLLNSQQIKLLKEQQKIRYKKEIKFNK